MDPQIREWLSPRPMPDLLLQFGVVAAYIGLFVFAMRRWGLGGFIAALMPAVLLVGWASASFLGPAVRCVMALSCG